LNYLLSSDSELEIVPESPPGTAPITDTAVESPPAAPITESPTAEPILSFIFLLLPVN
ncbi:hypothetical protein PENVUL_c138G03400, partial [Penicillium vulpinum]